MPTIQREVRKRGFFGYLFKWLFIVFNVLMLIWLIAYWAQIGGMVSGLESDAEKAGGAIGATLGTSMLLFFWVAGAIILGLFTLLTRGRSVYITEERP
jgi:membrane associated rhomboid family serine protease